MNNTSKTLQNILEALMTINTRGNDTITMSNCLQALSQTIEQVRHEEIQSLKENKEPEE